jgi:hypothetical protein
LVAYLHRGRSHFPVCPYIGVSKLTYKPCHLWITADNKKANSEQYRNRTKGTRDKHCSGWKSALLSNAVQTTVNEFVLEQVVKEYCVNEVSLGNAFDTVSATETEPEVDLDKKFALCISQWRSITRP